MKPYHKIKDNFIETALKWDTANNREIITGVHQYLLNFFDGILTFDQSYSCVDEKRASNERMVLNAINNQVEDVPLVHDYGRSEEVIPQNKEIKKKKSVFGDIIIFLEGFGVDLGVLGLYGVLRYVIP